MTFPDSGLPAPEVLAALSELARDDADWRAGRTFSLVYNAGAEVNALLEGAYRLFLQTNALSVTAFPSLRRLEAEVVAMTADLLHAPEPAGTLTSGGTESICMAVKAARDHARAERPDIQLPEMVLPVSAHPAFHKAAHYFGVRAVPVPVGPDFRADVAAMAAALTPHTILLVGSAPGFPHGVIDPIAELAALAAARGLWFHVDACVGGFQLPFLEALGEPIPPFDFRLPGVTSMSADVHKYGFAAKGASVVLYRSKALRRFQFFAYVDWPGGIYGSPSLAGARGGGPIAAAWAVFKTLGRPGFLRLADVMRQTTKRLQRGITALPGWQLLGEPAMSVFACAHESADVYAVAEDLEHRGGWRLDRLQNPPGLHFMVSPAHAAHVDEFLTDFAAATAAAAARPAGAADMAAMYGALTTLPDRGLVSDFVLGFMDGWYET